MRYAETGFNLEIDLTRGNIERVPTDPRLTELHLGGLGTNARIMWDRVGPEVEPFSPENLLIFGTGLLAGTPAPGCNRTIVTSISPQTRLLAFSMMGGFWGPELKHAGYDKVILRGKAPELVYLYINDDQVEIRDASRSGPRDPGDRGGHPGGAEGPERAGGFHRPRRGEQGLLRFHRAGPRQRQPPGDGRRHGGQEPQGHRRPGDQGHQHRPTHGVHRALQRRPSSTSSTGTRTPSAGSCPSWPGWGRLRRWRSTTSSGTPRTSCGATPGSGGRASGPRRSRSSGRAPWRACGPGSLSCHNCPMKCGASIAVDKRFCSYMMKCFSKLTYTMAAYSDLDFGLRMAQKATEYGVDAFSCPQTMAFALELYEAGILTDRGHVGDAHGEQATVSSGSWTPSCAGRGSATSWPTAPSGRPRRSGRERRSSPTTTSGRPSNSPSSWGC